MTTVPTVPTVPTFSTDAAIDKTQVTSVAQARNLIHAADSIRNRKDRANRKRFAQLFKDPKAIEITITLTDEVMRIHAKKQAALIFARSAKSASIKGFGFVNAMGLHLLRSISKI